MAKDKISDYSSTANSNTDIAGINIDEGCAPSGINDAIRTLMAQLKTWQSGGQDVYITPAGSASVPAVTTTGDTNTGLFFPAADTVGITTGGSERARVDSSGNLGLGVTPSAWGSVSRAMQFQNGVSIFSNTSGLGGLGNNVYSNPGTADYYIANGYATRYYQFNGTHVWNTAASGSAGGTISFTQAMTLDASSRLGVNTSDPSAGGGQMLVAQAQANGLVVNNTSSGLSPSLYLRDLVGSSTAKIRFIEGNGLDFITHIDNVRARIDSSGNLLVGTTSTGFSNTRSFTFQGVGDGKVYVNHSTANTNGDGFIGFGYNGSQIGSITQNGTTAVAYNTSSDYRLKNSIAPITGALAKVALLKPCTYKWNADDSDGEGFIAHELAEVCPHAVTGEKDAVDDNGNPKYQGIDTSFLVATLTAAIQELKATVDAQAARITALEQA